MLKLRLAITYGLLVLIFLLWVRNPCSDREWKIDISELLEEESGGASTSRFQLLIFTFVIGLSFVLIVACNCKFPDVPANVLALPALARPHMESAKGYKQEPTLEVDQLIPRPARKSRDGCGDDEPNSVGCHEMRQRKDRFS